MGIISKILGLFLTNMETDGEDCFNFERDLNQNFRKIENKTLNINHLTNCILSAPNGVITYSGSTVTIKAGLRVLIPDGFNTDGTLKNIDLTLENDLTRTESGNYATPVYLGINSSGGLVAFDNYIFSEEAPTKNYTLWYKPSENKTYLIQNETATLMPVAVIGKYGRNNGLITNVYPLNTVNLALKDDLDGKWQMKYAELDANKKTNGKSTYTYDLSSYLPDDGNIYDVLISAAAWTTPNSTNGDLLVFDCTTDIFERDGVSKNLCLLRIGGVTTTNQSSSVIVPVGTGRTIKTIIDVQNSKENRASIWLLGYRKAR